MGDGLKITKDKRHRSSSSLAGVVVEGTRSERRLEMNASIPEVDDQFAVAEARCDDLQEKIDLIKSLKRKRKLKKRSMTRVMDQPRTPDHVPLITVRTQPKKILLITEVSQQAARLRRLEVPPNPTRGYLDPATVEQHRMIGQVRGYNNAFKQPRQERSGLSKIPSHHSIEERKPYPKMQRMRQHRSQADGTYLQGVCAQGVQITTEGPIEVACGQDVLTDPYYEEYDRPSDMKPESCQQIKQASIRRKHLPRGVPAKEGEAPDPWRKHSAPSRPRGRIQQTSSGDCTVTTQAEERPVVELFNKSYVTSPPLQRQNTDPPEAPRKQRKARGSASRDDNHAICRLENILTVEQPPPKKEIHHPRRIKYRSRRYELPTVASQMKQAGVRYYYDTSNRTQIPFVVSKSTAPSHNIGVNIQQVLNGLKTQQPLSGIPLTIAHHMGLGHVPTYGSNSAAAVPALHHREINAIRVGQRLLRLPSHNYVSYNRLLSLYREGEGMVPRFLRAISRPHYFYTSMYNLTTNHEDFDGATSKGRGASQDAKQNLAEFASLYREYENINKCIKEGNYEPEMEHRKEELSKELAAREQHIRRVVQDYRSSLDVEQPLRASASTADDGYRHSAL
ncbi:uncharacterized protein LOC142986580 isoform X3 [Anticarsia gemmatalis]|uniref:uncharacterized protein LOC142986580 isoform X3 n=1 Tax=Anticarsia gemmatalis TaxID=129554 RepID=UPI003F75ABD4